MITTIIDAPAARVFAHKKIAKGDDLYLIGRDHVTHVVKVTDRYSSIIHAQAVSTVAWAADRPNLKGIGGAQATFHDVACDAPVLSLRVASVEAAMEALL